MSSFERIQQAYNNAVDKIANGVRMMVSTPQEKFDQHKPKNNIFNYLDSIRNDELFFYIVILVIAVFLTSRFNIPIGAIVGLIAGIIVVFYLRERQLALGDNFIMEHESKLEHNIFENTKNMHMDSTLIDMLYSIKEYKQYNPDIFIRLSRNIDNLLRIEKELEIGVENPGQLFDVAHDIQNKALNALHSMVHSIPHTPNSDKKYSQALESFNKLFSRHMNSIKRLVIDAQSKQPINIYTKPNIHQSNINPNDTNYDSNYEFFG